jgi:single-strand DNA-binding protein
MANDLNQCQFIGRLGRDPEVRFTPDGAACANFSIAVGESWKDKGTGEKQERTEWVRCVAWRQLAEIIGEYLKKGSQIYVSGKLQTRKWTDKEGAERYTTEVVVDRMQMLGSKRDAGEAGGDREERAPQKREPATTAAGGKTSGKFDDMDDDIPF